jgi:acyl-CoA thioesterase-1
MQRFIMFFVLIIALGVTAEAVRLVKLALSVRSNAAYWQNRAHASVGDGAFTYVALGDSVAQGIGASRPDRGYVGLTADAIARATGRPVRVINLSVTGATVADVIRTQLPELKRLTPDLITLDIGANDANHQISEATFKQDYGTLLAALPADRTVVCDIPPFGFRSDHGLVAQWNPFVRDTIMNGGFAFAPVYNRIYPRRHDIRIFGADVFHPSDTGYRELWAPAFASGVGTILSRTK